jgi:hypothetical protein
MAIDFDKIRKKVEQLSGNRKSALWSPKAGPGGSAKEYNLRILPWPDGNDGQPFKERSFYYNIGGGRAILAPSQFGESDPIQDLINKLRAEGTPASMELAKQFYSKRRYYAPVIVRGEEEEGVRLWSFGKTVVQELLNHMMGDYGDFTDLKTGRDVKITCSQPAGKQFVDTTATPRLKESEAGAAKQVKEWMANVPNLDEIYANMKLSADEIEKRVNDHLNGTSSSDGLEKSPQKRVVDTSDASTMDDVLAKFDAITEDE